MSAVTEERQPFDPSDPFDAMAESFRRQICEMGLQALSTAIYRDLEGYKQIECFIAGCLSGLVSVAFSHIKPDGRDVMMKYIKECLPLARQIVEEIEKNRSHPSGEKP